jgi:hypothetical protein
MKDYKSTIFFGKSNDCKFDGIKLEKKLSNYFWSESRLINDWSYDSNLNTLTLDESVDEEELTLCPYYIFEHIIEDDNGKIYRKEISEMAEDEFSLIIDSSSDTIFFNEMVIHLSEVVSEGYFELALVGNEENRHMVQERIRIYSNNCGNYDKLEINSKGELIETSYKVINGEFQ